MKTMVFTLCLFFLAVIVQAQYQGSVLQTRSGAVYVYTVADDQGRPPVINPLAIKSIDPSFLNPIDATGPIALDPTAVSEINPNFNFVIDGVDPGPGPFKRKLINPAFINPIESGPPIISDPRRIRKIDPSHVIILD